GSVRLQPHEKTHMKIGLQPRAVIFSTIGTALVLCVAALGQQPSPALQGAFTASAGPATYRGKWSASFSSRTPNTAAGSWILLNDQNDIVLQGTWSAHKVGTGWKGTWHASVLRGRAYSGTWTASEPGSGRTFADMLQAATGRGAAGTWATGGYGGNWRLTPNP
ncbi:MAG TPA: hypothetical protein VJN48_17735, partial [Terriglobales bacterium]|nr:hypothetical protein [Terriglobales bacterium]